VNCVLGDETSVESSASSDGGVEEVDGSGVEEDYTEAEIKEEIWGMLVRTRIEREG
jgi:hypothetical protein